MLKLWQYHPFKTLGPTLRPTNFGAKLSTQLFFVFARTAPTTRSVPLHGICSGLQARSAHGVSLLTIIQCELKKTPKKKTPSPQGNGQTTARNGADRGLYGVGTYSEVLTSAFYHGQIKHMSPACHTHTATLIHGAEWGDRGKQKWQCRRDRKEKKCEK